MALNLIINDLCRVQGEVSKAQQHADCLKHNPKGTNVQRQGNSKRVVFHKKKKSQRELILIMNLEKKKFWLVNISNH